MFYLRFKLLRAHFLTFAIFSFYFEILLLVYCSIEFFQCLFLTLFSYCFLSKQPIFLSLHFFISFTWKFCLSSFLNRLFWVSFLVLLLLSPFWELIVVNPIFSILFCLSPLFRYVHTSLVRESISLSTAWEHLLRSFCLQYFFLVLF